MNDRKNKIILSSVSVIVVLAVLTLTVFAHQNEKNNHDIAQMPTENININETISENIQSTEEYTNDYSESTTANMSTKPEKTTQKIKLTKKHVDEIIETNFETTSRQPETSTTKKYNNNIIIKTPDDLAKETTTEETTTRKPRQIVISGIVSMNFKAGETHQKVNFENSELNKDVCNMMYYMYIDENNNKRIDASDELLYSANKPIAPGEVTTDIELNRPLEKGIYTMLVFSQPTDIETGKELNNFVMVVETTVL